MVGIGSAIAENHKLKDDYLKALISTEKYGKLASEMAYSSRKPKPEDPKLGISQDYKQPERYNGGAGSFFWEFLKVILIALIVVVPLRYFVIQPFVVNGDSMEPNFHDKDYLIVDELSYRLGEPKRGDVVIFKYKGNTSEYFIKRIIGLPGERVEIGKGRVTIYNSEHPDGIVLSEGAYLDVDEKTSGEARLTLGTNEYFVVGDNRDASSDSRTWGALSRDDIVGKAWIRLLPLKNVGVVERFNDSYNLSLGPVFGSHSFGFLPEANFKNLK